ncbi:GGDEF domain-containing protein [Ectothiorhodospira lacustris]|uniref:GGDEF domain-containing protein n=1 Tax=Ectothiorhodospira lacustris TaxID=2899127 RepID=UPI001EE96A5B|nr:GGDEF domain-containing protein [Ectothiorhodospira lacustris]MCG5499372.1 GGDEF domain-containing protein [Ectothiorhodospira lacustris]MCG5509261.1 GGDEF domain-containing protein [Ectothiorhodospira lacustris]MCG5521051.1 GGDEF domain-containing protein [Ectothiorhodospira lacustris]
MPLEHLKTLIFILLPPVMLALGMGAAIQGAWLPELPQGLMEVLPWLMGGLAGVLAFLYGRTRTLICVILVLMVYLGSMFQIRPMAMAPDTDLLPALGYALMTLLVPLVFMVNAFWSERYHLMMDLLLRLAVFGTLPGIAVLFATQFPEGMADLLLTTHLPALHWDGYGMPQLSFWSLALCLAVMGGFVVRRPSPQWAGQWITLAGIGWMLPQLFHAYAVPLFTATLLLILAIAVVHESFQMAFRDDLTGLPGRRALNERMQRLGRRYAIAMTDVDHFKKFNDTHGHDLGDQVLRVVAARLRKVSGGGRAYRYGGEEFTIVFPGKTAEQCIPHLEAVREAIETYEIAIRDEASRPGSKQEGRARRGQGKQRTVSVTISMGVAERSPDRPDPESVIKAADQALYAAKQAGRNQVCRAE